MKKLLASGWDARGRGYQLYDYGDKGWCPGKTINGMPVKDPNETYRYVCFYDGRVFVCSNDYDYVRENFVNATEKSEYCGSYGKCHFFN